MPRKNLDLPIWVINELNRMAALQKNKFKPYVEWKLSMIAKQHKEWRLNPQFPVELEPDMEGIIKLSNNTKTK